MIINIIYARDFAKNFEEHEKFLQMLKRVVLEGRREGARHYFVADGVNVELDTFCMEDEQNCAVLGITTRCVCNGQEQGRASAKDSTPSRTDE